MNNDKQIPDASGILNIEIYKQLFDSIDQGVCIMQVLYDGNGRPVNLYCIYHNHLFESQTGVVGYLGRTALEVLPNLELSWLDLYDEVVKTGVAKRFENYVSDTDRWFEVFATRISDESNDKFVVLFSDISEKVRARTRTLVVNKIIEEMTMHSSSEALMAAVCDIICGYLSITACQFMHIDEASDSIYAMDTWHAPDVNPLPRRLKLSEQVNEEYVRRMHKGETVVSHDTQADPVVNAKPNAEIGAMAFISVPFLQEGEWKYLFSVHDAKPRNWRSDEIEFVEEIAGRIFPRLERARAEASLRKSEESYRQKLEEDVAQHTAELKLQNKMLREAQALGHVGDFYFDFGHNTVHWSEELYRIMGFEPGDALSFDEAISVYMPQDRERLEQLTAESLRTGNSFELEAEFVPKGQTATRCLFLKAEAVTQNGKGVGIKGVVQDITESAQLKQQLKRNMLELEQRNKTLTEAQAIGKIGDFRVDIRTREVTWSEEMYRMRGFEIGEPLTYEKILMNYSEELRKKFINYPQDILKTGKGFEFEIPFQPRGSNEWRWMFMKGEPVYGDKGEPVGTKGIAQDITQRKRAEQRISELNAQLLLKNRELESLNSELTTFNNIAANDYSQTLRTLYTNLEYVLKNDAKSFSNTGKANMRKAQTAIQKLKLLTEDIVAFSKIPAMDSVVDTVNLDQVLESVIEDLAPKIQEAELQIEKQKLPSIAGFPLLLSILFHHLVDNAAKFRSKMPVLRITAEPVEVEGTKYDTVSFDDNGIGFPAHESDNIFSIFYRLHDRQDYKGSGVGLAVCKKIMDLHGGFISATSEMGRNSKFRCYFPTNR